MCWQVILQFPTAFWDTSVEFFGAALPPGDAATRGLCFMFWNLQPLTGQPILTALVSGQARPQSSHMAAGCMQATKAAASSKVPSIGLAFKKSAAAGPVCCLLQEASGPVAAGPACVAPQAWGRQRLTGAAWRQAAHEWEGRPVPDLQAAAMKVLRLLFADAASEPIACTASAWRSEPYVLGEPAVQHPMLRPALPAASLVPARLRA